MLAFDVEYKVLNKILHLKRYKILILSTNIYIICTGTFIDLLMILNTFKRNYFERNLPKGFSGFVFSQIFPINLFTPPPCKWSINVKIKHIFSLVRVN